MSGGIRQTWRSIISCGCNANDVGIKRELNRVINIFCQAVASERHIYDVGIAFNSVVYTVSDVRADEFSVLGDITFDNQ